MNFDHQRVFGRFIKRYKRFLSDIELDDGQIITAYTPNTGAMTSCLSPGHQVMLTKSDRPGRKLPYTLELAHNGTCWIGLHSALANTVVFEAAIEGRIPELAFYESYRQEVKVEDSRIDLFCQGQGSTCFVEVKSVTLAQNDWALFPDAVTSRGRKHLDLLAKLVQEGHRCVMFYLVQRSDVHQFAPADFIDPSYAKALDHATEVGVEVLVYGTRITDEAIDLDERIPYVKRSSLSGETCEQREHSVS